MSPAFGNIPASGIEASVPETIVIEEAHPGTPDDGRLSRFIDRALAAGLLQS